MHRFRASTAQIQVVLGCSRFVREALDGYEIALHAAHFRAAQLIELLLGVIRQFRGIELEQYDDIARRFVIVQICDAFVQFAVELRGQLALHLIRLLRRRIRTPQRIPSSRIRGIRLLCCCADLRFVALQLFLRVLCLLLHFFDLRADGVGLLRHVLLRRAASEKQQHAGHDRYFNDPLHR